MSLTTLSSDSSPFHEKYSVDEDAELLGEVRFISTGSSVIVPICQRHKLVNQSNNIGSYRERIR